MSLEVGKKWNICLFFQSVELRTYRHVFATLTVSAAIVADLSLLCLSAYYWFHQQIGERVSDGSSIVLITLLLFRLNCNCDSD
jgi:hypothetical protein